MSDIKSGVQPLADSESKALDEQAPWVMADPVENDEARSNPLGLIFLAGLFAWLWFGAGPRYFLVVVGLVVMIFLHELGHFMTARWTGMKASQFFLFMGPRLWSFKRGETEYGIRLLPIGAFVRILGMHNLDPVAPEDEHRAYRNKSYAARMFVITAGSMMHFIQAIVLFIVVSSVIGPNDPNKWTIDVISQVNDGSPPGSQSPAILADLQPGDDIVAIDGFDVTNWGEAVEYIASRPGDEVALTFERAGETFERSTVLTEIERRGEQVGFLGVAPSFERTRLSPVEGVKNFGSTLWEATKSIPRFVSPSTLGQLASLMVADGPVDVEAEAERPVSLVGATRIAGDPDFDITVPIGLLGVFNVFIGVLNLMPLLPLDGGHAAVATYEAVRSRKGRRYHVDIAKLLPITYAVVLLLGFIMVSTVYLDIVRPIG